MLIVPAYFVAFLVFLCADFSTSFLISPSLASAKSFFSFCFAFHDDYKFILKACSFLGFSAIEIKSDDGYQIDGGYRLITIVRFCIT